MNIVTKEENTILSLLKNITTPVDIEYIQYHTKISDCTEFCNKLKTYEYITGDTEYIIVDWMRDHLKS